MLTVRTTPLRPLTVDRSLDRAFDQLVGSLFEPRRSAGPVVDASWQGDTYVLTVDLPGVPASAVDVEVTGTTLALHVSTDQLDWHRSVRLGGRLDPDKIEASHVDGRLTVRIGSVDAPEARRVQIATTPLTAIEQPDEQAAIEAEASDATSDQSSEANDAG